jgi:hypothetical protein
MGDYAEQTVTLSKEDATAVRGKTSELNAAPQAFSQLDDRLKETIPDSKELELFKVGPQYTAALSLSNSLPGVTSGILVRSRASKMGIHSARFKGYWTLVVPWPAQ